MGVLSCPLGQSFRKPARDVIEAFLSGWRGFGNVTEHLRIMRDNDLALVEQVLNHVAFNLIADLRFLGLQRFGKFHNNDRSRTRSERACGGIFLMNRTGLGLPPRRFGLDMNGS